MLNRIREHFGTAGLVVAIMALVLALAGGAFAASGGLNAKQKKQVKAIAKGLVPTGPAGAAGPKGDTGAAGSAASINGVAAGGALSGTYPNPGLAAGSVGTANFAAGATAPDAGKLGGILPSGFQQDVTGTCAAGNAIRDIANNGTVTCQSTAGGSGTVTSITAGTGLTATPSSPITTAGTLAVDPAVVQSRVSTTCAAGQAMTAIAEAGTATCASTLPATLPSGATETGTWVLNNPAGTADAVDVSGDKYLFAPLSFAVPVPAAMTNNAERTHYQTDANFTDFNGAVAGTTGCAGSAANPTAPSGHLCVYVSALATNIGSASTPLSAPGDGGGITPDGLNLGMASSGTTLAFLDDGNNAGMSGTFAVTG